MKCENVVTEGEWAQREGQSDNHTQSQGVSALSRLSTRLLLALLPSFSFSHLHQ